MTTKLNPADFSIHDVSKFPIVTVNNDAMVPAYSLKWEREMNRLAAHGVPFAIVYRGAVSDETFDDFAARKRWLERYEQRLSELCRVLVVVGPDAILREKVTWREEHSSEHVCFPGALPTTAS